MTGLAGKQVTPGGAILQIARLDRSYESFVREHGPRLVQTLSLILRDRELANDVSQDALIQLYNHWSRVEEIRDPLAWLYRVAINRSNDYRRRVRRTARLFERLITASNDDDWVAADVTGSLLVAAFRSLPQGQRTAATLFYLADLPVAEVARVMNVTEGTVNRHLHRARQALKRTLEAD